MQETETLVYFFMLMSTSLVGALHTHWCDIDTQRVLPLPSCQALPPLQVLYERGCHAMSRLCELASKKTVPWRNLSFLLSHFILVLLFTSYGSDRKAL